MTNPNQALLDATIAAVRPTDKAMQAAAEARQVELTKPVGSLGLLEVTGNRLCAIFRQCPPPLPSKAIAAVFCGDHGVMAHRISPWNQEVTLQMTTNVALGGASINSLAAAPGIEVWPIDVGVAHDLPDLPNLRRHRVRNGTGDISTEPAMTRDDALEALAVGIRIANEAVEAGADTLIPGEVGIGNTGVAAAIISAMTGEPASVTTGRGAGSGNNTLDRKTAIIQAALDLHQPDPSDPVGVLAAVGGLEHAAMAGYILAGAAAGRLVILDGVIACGAALIVEGLCPTATEYFVAGHKGCEPGIGIALDRLGLEPLVHLGMRLGEGGGASVAFPIVQASANVLRIMATFAEAGVNENHDAS